MRRSQNGFSLVELMISMSVMLLIAGAATTALLKMTSAQATIWNRTQMHSGIRGATEVLQQEVGQAGRIALPNVVMLGGAVTAGSSQTVTMTCSGTCLTGTTATSGMFLGEKLVIDAGCFDTAAPCTSRQETILLTATPTSTQITAVFANAHGT
ncbi:MAG TPA: prepilin-type N-terminal cleavage/methylation domain-containing protein, partial [Vicinamibacterales bacterium]